MKKISRDLIFTSLILLFSVFQLHAQDSLVKRPRIGLVLSGGGAKGMAHIGVLKVLEKHHIPIDYITGTSMGSIIGGLYAMGYNADELEKLTQKIDWDEIFSGSIMRSDISIEEKSEADKYLLQFSLKEGKFVLPKGMISGQKLEKLLARITWPVHGVNDFLKLPIPFACIATDIETGEAYVLKKGYLPDALRASMSIPSVFTPVEIDGRLLVDGGLIRNLPASDVKAMGADIIIGVDVGSPLYKKEELTSALAIMDQAASFRNAELLEQEKELCDILISPDITGYSAASFDATDTLIQRGENAALAMEKQIIELAKNLGKYKGSISTTVNPTALHSIFIDEIIIKGLDKVSEKLVRSRMNIEAPVWVDLKSIEKGVDRIYGSQFFEKVNYKIIQDSNKTNLIIRVYEKPFSVLKVGANYNNYFNASLLLNGTFRNLLGEGSKLTLNAKLSEAPEATVDYSVFTKLKPSIGFRMKLDYFTLNEKLYFPEDSLNLSMRHHDLSGKLALVSSLTNSVYLATGIEYAYQYFNIVELEQSNYNADFNRLKLFGEFYIDTYDRTVFPNKGLLLRFKTDYMLGLLGNEDYSYDEKYWRLSLSVSRYIPLWKKFNVNYRFNSTLVFSENVFIGDYYRLGGEMDYKSYVFPMSGFRFMEFKALNILTGRIGFRYEFLKNKYILMNADGAFKSDKIDRLVVADDFLFSGAMGLGANTVIGPLEFRVGKNNFNKNWSFWLQLGYYF